MNPLSSLRILSIIVLFVCEPNTTNIANAQSPQQNSSGRITTSPILEHAAKRAALGANLAQLQLLPSLLMSLTTTVEEKAMIACIEILVRSIQQEIFDYELAIFQHYCRCGKLDLMIEAMSRMKVPSHLEVEYWERVLDACAFVVEKVRYHAEKVSDVHLHPEWKKIGWYLDRENTKTIFSDRPVIDNSIRSDFRGALRAPVMKLYSVQRSLLNASESIRTDDLLLSHLVCNGDVAVRSGVAQSLLISDGDVDMRTVRDGIIIARGSIRMDSPPGRSILIASSEIHAKKLRKELPPPNATLYIEKSKKPLDFIEWFETSQVGIDVDRVEANLVIKRLDDLKPFAKAGCRVGDIILRAGANPNPKPEEFRRDVRRGVIEGEIALSILRGKEKIAILVPLDNVLPIFKK